MYGTVARVIVKDGMLEDLRLLNRALATEIDGIVFEHMIQSARDPNECWLVVAFASQAAYDANAAHPEQHQRYLRLRELLVSDPEWHDGSFVDSYDGDGR